MSEYEPDSRRQCTSVKDDPPNIWACTLVVNHDGDHVAHWVEEAKNPPVAATWKRASK